MTKEERLLQALNDVGDDLIQQAGEKPKRFPRSALLGMAACLALVIGLVSVGGFAGGNSDGGTGNESAGNGMGQAITYDAYMGPVMPLTLMEAAEGLRAARAVTYDFASYTEPDHGIVRLHSDVTDAYMLTNSTDADMTVTAVYPFRGALSDHDVIVPCITVEGTEVEAGMIVGGALYSDGYADSGEKLISVLSDGSYFASALDSYPTLTRPVTVYHISALTYDGPVGDHPTLAMSFTAPPDRSRVLIAGGGGLQYDDESGEFRLRMDTMDFIYGGDVYVVILGEDIDGYTLQGYSDYTCEEGDEVEGFHAEIERSETTLDGFLEGCIDWESWVTMYNDGLKMCIGARMTSAELIGLTAQSMMGMGALDITGLVDGLFLEDYISSALYAGRMLYLTFPVTIAAGETVTVTAEMVKYASSGYHGRDEDQQGYDLMTGLGSVLELTEQTVSVVNTENVDFVDGNFGFDAENGVTEVTLDMSRPHYWMQVRKK